MKIHDSFRVFSLFEIWYVVITNLISLAALCFCAIWNSISQPLRLEIKRKLAQRSERVKSVDLHPSEPWILASLYSGTVCIWNYQTQKLSSGVWPGFSMAKICTTVSESPCSAKLMTSIFLMFFAYRTSLFTADTLFSKD
uniref:Uncharacterized protein n=1 Tax=Solanum lycopersicum TaxID=4081 RepID=A0A3Q7J913_SOLLC